MKKFYLSWSLVLLVAFSFNLYAQDGVSTCATEEINQEYFRNNPEARERQKQFEALWQDVVSNMGQSKLQSMMFSSETEYEIPLVFHIIHPDSPLGSNFNPTDQSIQEVVDYLNHTFAATWPAYPAFNNGGAKVNIKFTLAKRDPNCNPTNGIVRVNTLAALSPTDAAIYEEHGVKSQANYPSGLDDIDIKNLSRWDNQVYYNIWVVNKIDGWSGYVPGSGVVGYAYYPGASADVDGTVIMEAFNKPGQSTLPHELGHGLNLRHTFQGGCGDPNDCATTGDMVCDTDPHNQVAGCPSGLNPCTNTPWDPVKHNIMNYTSCPDRFTAQQAARMELALTTQRANLLNSLGGVEPGQEELFEPITAAVCQPDTTTPNVYSMGVTKMVINNFQYYSPNYPAAEAAYYIDYTDMNCLSELFPFIQLTKGETYEVLSEHWANKQNTKIWIDYNNDGELSEDEVFFNSYNLGDPNEVTTQIYQYVSNSNVVPNTAISNTPLRLRVINDYIESTESLSCSDLAYGRALDFTVVISTPLNTILNHISAKINEDIKSIDVAWKASEEKELVYYEIQKSLDGKVFKTIGKTKPTGPNMDYSFTDNLPQLDAQNFYRLKMIHFDQKATYSKVVSEYLKTSKVGSFVVSPNPFNKFFNIHSTNEFEGTLKIINVVGQEVYVQEGVHIKAGAYYTLKFEGLPLNSNLYHLMLISHDGKITHKTMMKK